MLFRPFVHFLWLLPLLPSEAWSPGPSSILATPCRATHACHKSKLLSAFTAEIMCLTQCNFGLARGLQTRFDGKACANITHPSPRLASRIHPQGPLPSKPISFGNSSQVAKTLFHSSANKSSLALTFISLFASAHLSWPADLLLGSLHKTIREEKQCLCGTDLHKLPLLVPRWKPHSSPTQCVAGVGIRQNSEGPQPRLSRALAQR